MKLCNHKRFNESAIYDDGLYYFPLSMYATKDKLSISACYYDKYRRKWMEDSFYPSFNYAYELIQFAIKKHLI